MNKQSLIWSVTDDILNLKDKNEQSHASTLSDEDSSEGLANFIHITEMENEEKQNSLLNTLGTEEKKNIWTLFWGFLLSAIKGKRKE